MMISLISPKCDSTYLTAFSKTARFAYGLTRSHSSFARAGRAVRGVDVLSRGDRELRDRRAVVRVAVDEDAYPLEPSCH